jgi:formylglycine-generating enzyme required for sulfatase activity
VKFTHVLPEDAAFAIIFMNELNRQEETMRLPILMLQTLFLFLLAALPALAADDNPPAGTPPRVDTAVPDKGSPLADPTTGMEFVPVKGGCYRMGDTAGIGEADERPAHEVCVGDFLLGKYEVTQGEWKRVMGRNQAYFSACGDRCPMDNVNWNDVQEFIKKLNKLSGKSYRLPTEAEWEYACRDGGKEQKFCGGDDASLLAWHYDNAASVTHPVGLKQPNGLGLYDMSGNVWEMVEDRYGKGYYASSPKENPQGPPTGKFRVGRGGSWFIDPRSVRSTGRYRYDPTERYNIFGFRLVAPAR